MYRSTIDPLFEDFESDDRRNDNVGSDLFRDVLHRPKKGEIL